MNQQVAYKAALVGQADVVVLCAALYVDFANIQCKSDYIRSEYYMSYIEENRSNLKNLAKDIDRDLKIYWNGSLSGLLTKHDLLCSEYAIKTKKIRKKKHVELVELFGAPNMARLDTIKSDIGRALRGLPAKEFSDSSHVSRWRSATTTCCKVISDAHDAHIKIVEKINTIDQKRYDRIRARNTVLLGLASTAVNAAKVFIGAAPTP